MPSCWGISSKCAKYFSACSPSGLSCSRGRPCTCTQQEPNPRASAESWRMVAEMAQFSRHRSVACVSPITTMVAGASLTKEEPKSRISEIRCSVSGSRTTIKRVDRTFFDEGAVSASERMARRVSSVTGLSVNFRQLRRCLTSSENVMIKCVFRSKSKKIISNFVPLAAGCLPGNLVTRTGQQRE